MVLGSFFALCSVFQKNQYYTLWILLYAYSSPLSLLHQLVFLHALPTFSVPSCCTPVGDHISSHSLCHPISYNDELSNIRDHVHYPLNSQFQLTVWQNLPSFFFF